MMDFISVPLVVGIVCAGIYGLFELFVRRRERLAIIEKIGDKLDASAFDGKLGLPNYMRNFSFSSLKAGCLLAGIGLGLLVGFIINMCMATNSYYDDGWYRHEVAGIHQGAREPLARQAAVAADAERGPAGLVRHRAEHPADLADGILRQSLVNNAANVISLKNRDVGRHNFSPRISPQALERGLRLLQVIR